MIKKFMAFSIAKKVIFVLMAIIIVVLLVFIFKSNNANQETITVKLGNFTNQVSVSGKVIAAENVDLGFSQGGRVSSVRAHVGDMINAGAVIASVENGDLQANLIQREAGLSREQARLKSLENGTRPEQIAVAESAVESAKTSLDQATQGLVNEINNAYTKSDDAIRNKVDQFFNNATASNPTLMIFLNDDSLISKVNFDRIEINNILSAWKNTTLKISSKNLSEQDILTAQANLNKIRTFLNEVSSVTNNSNSTYAGGSIPAVWKSDTSIARSNIDIEITALEGAITSYRSAKTGLTTQENNLSLQKAGATKEDIDAQSAQVKSAEADVVNARAMLNKTLVFAPFSGVITKMDAKVGEVASPNVSLITMMGVGNFQIESYVPEVNVSKVKVGYDATVTLDAYGSDVFFNAKVAAIDPAETIRSGVSSYKIKLQFNEKDDRIKSGMTANVDIITFSKPNVFVLPGGVVFEKSAKKYVQIKTNQNSIIDTEITLGEESSLGQVEIISGVKEGDLVILNPVVK